MKIGFIGIGIMGSLMAANLQRQGYELVVFNRSPEKAATLVKNGAILAKNPAELASQVDIVFTMLAHPEAVETVALGERGFLDSLQPDSLWVDCSTVNPQFSRQISTAAKARQVNLLDAPVAGSKNQAAKRELVFLVGGREADLRTCQPLLESMGKKVIYVGESGMGISLKLVLNLLLGASMVAFAEAMVLGEALGISLEMLLKVLLGSPVVAPFVSLKKDQLQGAKQTEFPLQWMQKDLQMVATTASEIDIAMPLANLIQEVFQQAIDEGLGTEDFSAIYSFLQSQVSRDN